MLVIKKRDFANGTVYGLRLSDGYPIEVTDTFLPYYTKDAVGQKTNILTSDNFGSRKERWMIGVSTMSGCPVKCAFCATGKLKRYRNLSAQEIVDQVFFVLGKNKDRFVDAIEHKINYTRMGEPFLNIEAVKEAIEEIDSLFPGTHHYISTIGIKGSDFSWIKDNITLQLSLHSLDEERRNNLIPIRRKMTIKELGEVRTQSFLKTTLNLTMAAKEDWNINELENFFDKNFFFVKVSPINPNEISEKNRMGTGIIQASVRDLCGT